MITFQQAQQQKGIVMVEFYASWCPHCQKMIPTFRHITEKLKGRASIFQYDIDTYEKESDEAGVEIVPTFIIYRNGHEMWRYSGEIDESTLLNKIQTIMDE